MSASGSEDGSSGCELGKYEYWQTAYERELKTFEETGQEGEIWCATHAPSRRQTCQPLVGHAHAPAAPAQRHTARA